MIKILSEAGLYRTRYLVLFSCIVFAVCYFSILDDFVDTLESAEKKEVFLKSRFERKQDKYRNLEPFKQQQLELIKALDFYVKAMPDEIDINKEQFRVVNLSKQYDLSDISLVFSNKIKAEFYFKQPFTLKVSGSFNDIYYFLYDFFYGSDRAASLHDFSITFQENEKSLNLKIEGKLYGYLTDEGER